MIKQAQFKIVGMQRDLSASSFNSKYSYENKNIRIMPTDESTLLSIINEKGNKECPIDGITSIEGTPVGQALLNNKLILFTSGIKGPIEATVVGQSSTINNIVASELETSIEYTSKDNIYKLWFEGNILKGKTLFNGDLKFDSRHPIETLSFYENSDIEKVYWGDNLNQGRVINIEAPDSDISKWTADSFNFVRTLGLKESVNISRNTISGGSFPSGVIQYAFTYFSKYGQESNIFYASPLFYTSHNNRGGSPEDNLSNSFNINITNPDVNFDYLRIYSIIRTSIDATPTCMRVVDIAINSDTTSLSYIDSGTSGDIIDPTELLYVGGEEIVFGTLEQKDNTLFLGDFTLKRKLLDSTIRNYFKGKDISFISSGKSISPPTPKGYYPYSNQLLLNSYQFKTFKYLEWYRFGIQAQHYTGKWSEPIFINDVRNTTHISTNFYDSGVIGLPTAQFTINDSTIIDRLVSQGYIRVRPVVVYPTINDRESICQGVLCPTVYNISDRYSNSPFSQSSWFVRPNAPFDISNSETDWFPLGSTTGNATKYSRAGITKNGTYSATGVNVIDLVNQGSWTEFRHNYPIPRNIARNSEIQCISATPEPYIPSSLMDSTAIVNWITSGKVNYFVDQSILTLHSPDIEFDDSIKSIDTSNLKLRIIGMVPITSFAGDIDIQVSTPVNAFNDTDNVALPVGFYKEPIGVENEFSGTGNSHFGWRSLLSGAFWYDEITGYKSGVSANTAHTPTGFVVYPWHRNGSLNNTKFTTNDSASNSYNYKSAMLNKKKESNIRFSYKTQYLDSANIWNAYISGSTTNTGISDVGIFNSEEVTLIRLNAPLNSNLPSINYYGNIDKVLQGNEYPIMTTGSKIVNTDHNRFIGNYSQVSADITSQTTSTDPVRMKYKSTPHAVVVLNYATDGSQRVLPTIQDNNNGGTPWNINYVGGNFSDRSDSQEIIIGYTENQDGSKEPVYDTSVSTYNVYEFWDKNHTTTNISQDIISGIPGDLTTIGGIQYGWLWLGELYNDNVSNRFGGQTEEAFENNSWVPCGEPVALQSSVGINKTSVTLNWIEGDTYYQRYDNIKTYPFTLEDQNSVTDIVSFMCETRVNLDGRYDNNRGQTSNLAITPENFNKMNKVYSQMNTFFNFRTVNPNKLNLDNFRNSITWTKTKTAGSLVDTWTNITLASTLDLDGDKGDIRSLKRFNNNLIAFQDRGVSQILFNESMQIASSEGVPIEIANSGKVNGKRYISDKIGCANKWSICVTSNGIYFIDDTTKGIYLFNGQFDNLSDRLGFHSWINEKSTGINIWNPEDFSGFVSYYDKVNGDVFFISKEQCLAYSEPLGEFSSFYSYESMPYFINLIDKGIAFNTSYNDSTYKAWLHNEGDYNMYFGSYKPFYITLIANPDMPKDKIFNNVEFRADSWSSSGTLLNTTFDNLKVWNEYQYGESNLSNLVGRPSSLKKKFRIWRANIPRSSINYKDRIRNPWVYLKLSMNAENTNKTLLHDIIVDYFE